MSTQCLNLLIDDAGRVQGTYQQFSVFFVNYNHFFRTQMNFDQLLNSAVYEDLLLLGKNPSFKEQVLRMSSKEENLYGDIMAQESKSDRDELMNYMDCLELPPTKSDRTACADDLPENGSLTLESTQICHQTSGEKSKKQKKVENSPFHNYQKHLNNALKKLVVVPKISSQDDEYKLAARDLWEAYTSGDIKTKKILHFIFNERNEHAIKDGELQKYGLLEVYNSYGIQVLSRARRYLSTLAVDQIDEETIENYILSRKMKRTEGFKEYVLRFRKELQSGFIKRRVNFQE